MHRVTLIAIILATFAMFACGGTKEKPTPVEIPPAADQATAETEATGQTDSGAKREAQATTTPLAARPMLAAELLTDPSSPLNAAGSPLRNRLIHFAFDSARVDQSELSIVGDHGRFLAEHSDLKVRLEGHADERGTREYNMALGERRAQAVARLLKYHGVLDDQLETISFGEERPVAFGSNEAAWAQNRRVEIVYEAK